MMSTNKKILLVLNGVLSGKDTPAAQAMGRIVGALLQQGFEAEYAYTVQDAEILLKESMGLGAIGVYVAAADESPCGLAHIGEMVSMVRERNADLPIFLLSDSNHVFSILPLDVLKEIREYVHIYSETPSFISERIKTAIEQYNKNLLPVYFKSLKEFTESGDYYWDCPGHMGGMAYKKHPVGAEFLSFFGENMLRADIGVATSEMGDYLEHAGPPKASEARAAKAFGAEWTFYCVGGSSASNRIVAQGAIGADEICLVDRNCHKSLNHGLTLSHARPVYLQPTRNAWGMIGPIPTERLGKESVKQLIQASAFSQGAASVAPSYAVVTNCTYDGFCYNVDDVVRQLGQSVPRIHFDEAWYAYAKFHPLYRHRFAMGAASDQPDAPTLFAVQSTHKMLPALSMASMIHVKTSPRAPLSFQDFNDAFMMHGTTSPYYPIIASIDVAVSMMEGASGESLLQEAIDDAVAFRKAVVSIKRKFEEEEGAGSWFFDVLQPREVTDPQTQVRYRFEEAPAGLLGCEPSCWQLGADEDWHGFAREDIAGTDCMLDPVKVTITCPGMRADGTVEARGIPGYVLTKFLDSRRTEIARTGDYTLLILFSVGTTKGKWGALLETLLEFKRLYDEGASVAEAIPELAQAHAVYADMSLKTLCDTMHGKMTELSLLKQLDAAVSVAPQPVLTPAAAFQQVVRYRAEPVKVEDFAGRIAASMLVPYPPGIPLLMPGERVPAGDNPIVSYLSALQVFDRAFPGFEHEVHGVSVDEQGNFWVRALVEDAREAKRFTGTNLRQTRSSAVKKGRH